MKGKMNLIVSCTYIHYADCIACTGNVPPKSSLVEIVLCHYKAGPQRAFQSRKRRKSSLPAKKRKCGKGRKPISCQENALLVVSREAVNNIEDLKTSVLCRLFSGSAAPPGLP